MAYNFKSKEEVQEFLDKLGIEYRFGCFHEKNPEVCHLMGDYLESIDKNFEKAAQVYKDNCNDRSFAKSCCKYGNYRLVGKGAKDSGSNQDAMAYYEKGCNLDDGDACLNYGLMLVTPTKDVKPDVLKGMELLKKSCAKDVGLACYYLSNMFISGVLNNEATARHVPTSHSIKTPEVKASDFLIQKNMEEAFKYSVKACELGNIYACANLSQMYKRGDGVAKDETLSDKYKKTALEMQEALQKQQHSLKFQQGL